MTLQAACNGQLLANNVQHATSHVARLKGLLGRDALRPGEGMLIEPCKSIHMFGMRFAIDAVFVDRSGQVIAVHHNLKPWHATRSYRKARAVLELPAGQAHAIRVGDRLVFKRQ